MCLRVSSLSSNLNNHHIIDNKCSWINVISTVFSRLCGKLNISVHFSENKSNL